MSFYEKCIQNGKNMYFSDPGGGYPTPCEACQCTLGIAPNCGGAPKWTKLKSCPTCDNTSCVPSDKSVSNWKYGVNYYDTCSKGSCSTKCLDQCNQACDKKYEKIPGHPTVDSVNCKDGCRYREDCICAKMCNGTDGPGPRPGPGPSRSYTEKSSFFEKDSGKVVVSMMAIGIPIVLAGLLLWIIKNSEKTK